MSMMLKRLLFVIFLWVLVPTTVFAGKIHVLLVIDTHADKAVALGIPLDGVHLIQLFNQLPAQERAKLKVTILAGRDATPDKIRAYYKDPQFISHPDDVLFFFYSGHGMTAGEMPENLLTEVKKNGPFFVYTAPYLDPTAHVFTMQYGFISRKEVEVLQNQKFSRLNIIAADCCAGFPNRKPGANREGYRGQDIEDLANGTKTDENIKVAPAANINTDLWQKLFDHNIGTVHIAATPIGINARGDTKYGGHMPKELLEKSFSQGLYDRGISWYDFVTYPMADFHRKNLPKPIIPNNPSLNTYIVSEIGPVVLGQGNFARSWYKTDQFYDETNRVLFAIGSEGGIAMRVMPNSKTTLKPGLGQIYAIDGRKIDFRKSIDELAKLKQEGVKHTLTVSANLTSQKINSLTTEINVPFAPRQRTLWEHSRGSIERAELDSWIEHVQSNPPLKFKFTEVKRDHDYIELHDPSRDCYVKITATQLFVMNKKDGQKSYSLFYSGEWKR
jgi:hypothetical protein